MTVAVVLAVAVLAARRPRRRPRRVEASPLVFLEMSALGVSAGLSFHQAANLAVAEADGATATAVTAVLRGGDAGDAWLRRTFAVAGRAAETGAPLLPALDGLIAEMRAVESQRRLERTRKLPVKLLFPLALLVLPGFLLLTVAPVVAGSLQRLGL